MTAGVKIVSVIPTHLGYSGLKGHKTVVVVKLFVLFLSYFSSYLH